MTLARSPRDTDLQLIITYNLDNLQLRCFQFRWGQTIHRTSIVYCVSIHTPWTFHILLWSYQNKDNFLETLEIKVSINSSCINGRYMVHLWLLANISEQVKKALDRDASKRLRVTLKKLERSRALKHNCFCISSHCWKSKTTHHLENFFHSKA